MESKPHSESNVYSDDEVAERMNATLKRMLATPPTPHRPKGADKPEGKPTPA